MFDATPMPRNTFAANSSKQDQDTNVFELVLGFLETTFPSFKSYLSWEDELREVGPIMPELC